MKQHHHHGGPHSHGDAHAHSRVPFEAMTDDSVICNCNHLTLKELRGAVANGAQTPDEALARYGMEIRCGACVQRMATLMARLKDDRS